MCGSNVAFWHGVHRLLDPTNNYMYLVYRKTHLLGGAIKPAPQTAARCIEGSLSRLNRIKVLSRITKCVFPLPSSAHSIVAPGFSPIGRPPPLYADFLIAITPRSLTGESMTFRSGVVTSICGEQSAFTITTQFCLTFP